MNIVRDENYNQNLPRQDTIHYKSPRGRENNTKTKEHKRTQFKVVYDNKRALISMSSLYYRNVLIVLHLDAQQNVSPFCLYRSLKINLSMKVIFKLLRILPVYFLHIWSFFWLFLYPIFDFSFPFVYLYGSVECVIAYILNTGTTVET